MKHIVVVDIDGTIAQIGDRLKYITHQNPKDYDAFYDHCDEDIKEMRAAENAALESLKNFI